MHLLFIERVRQRLTQPLFLRQINSQPPMKTLLALLLALALLPLGGCASLTKKKITAPAVSLADIELQGIKGLETIFRLQLRVINNDDEPLALRGLSCALQVNGKSFANGISSEPVTVPASGSATVPVLVYAGMFDLVGPVIELIQSGGAPPSGQAKPLEYELTGKILLGEQGSGERIPFSLKGSLPPEKRS
ncbi:LEA type 2 family protein [Candidatus Electronema sp. TJ]|uniref:LEA type 2 family protein n=1 Tax=Candidatus Electronema sp. TJ TaxID=3401573 RepID=UPI003AA93BFD